MFSTKSAFDNALYNLPSIEGIVAEIIDSSTASGKEQAAVQQRSKRMLEFIREQSIRHKVGLIVMLDINPEGSPAKAVVESGQRILTLNPQEVKRVRASNEAMNDYLTGTPVVIRMMSLC